MPNRPSCLLAVAAAVSLAAPSSTAQQSPDHYEPTWESLSRHPYPELFRDAKFGIYWHWGPYSVPAYRNEWYPRLMYMQPPADGSRPGRHRYGIYDYHAEHYGPAWEFGYKDFIPLFRAEKFDPAEWAELIRRSGARFAGPIGTHIDGFLMWDSDITEWDAADMGPRRDIVGEMAETIRAEGLKFMVSLHHDRNWWAYEESYKLGRPVDTQDPRFACATCLYPEPHEPGAPVSKGYMEWWEKVVKEVVDKYRPDLIWFDGALNNVEIWREALPEFGREHLREAIAYYYNRALACDRDVVMTYKHQDFAPGAGILDIERGRMDDLSPFPWLTDTSISRVGWSYLQHPDYKPANELVDVLVDIVSKNGNMLLNIAPRPDGTIPWEQQGLLLAIGEWLERNGEAIYGTRPWKIFGEAPTNIAGGGFSENNEVAYTNQDVRFTTKGDALYAIVLDWPGRELTIASLAGVDRPRIRSVDLLGSSEQLEWSTGPTGLTIRTPIERPGDYAYTYRIRFEGGIPEPSR